MDLRSVFDPNIPANISSNPPFMNLTANIMNMNMSMNMNMNMNMNMPNAAAGTDFYINNPNANTINSFQYPATEAILADNARSKLRKCLSLAYESERTSEWLFTEKDYPYLQDGPALSAQAFKSSLAMRMSHRIDCDSSPLLYLMMKLNDKTKRHDANEKRDDPPHTDCDVMADLLFTPVFFDEDETLLFGYVLSVPVYINPESAVPSFPLPEAMKSRPHGNGRFVYNQRSKQMLVVMNSVTTALTVIFCLNLSKPLSGPTGRERHIFGVPNREYKYPNLPKAPSVVFSNVDCSVSPTTNIASNMFFNYGPKDKDKEKPTSSRNSSTSSSSLGLEDNSTFNRACSADCEENDSPMSDEVSQPIVQHCDSVLGMDEVLFPNQLMPQPCVDDDVNNGLTSPTNPSFSQDFSLGAAINDANLSSPLFSPNINPPEQLRPRTSSPELPISPFAENPLIEHDSPSPAATAAERSSSTSSTKPSLVDTQDDANPNGKKDTSFNSDLSAITSTLSELKMTMTGKFFSSNFKRDVLDARTGEMRERLTGQMVSESNPVVASIRSQMVEYAARCYYSASMSAVMGAERTRVHSCPPGILPTFRVNWQSLRLSTATSTPLLPPPIPLSSTQQEQQLQQQHELQHQLQYQEQELHQYNQPISLLPKGSNSDSNSAPSKHSSRHKRTNNICPGVSSGVSKQPLHKPMDEQKIKQMKLEEKRRRNRESAARSNLKRKLREQQQFAELETLKERVVLLKERQRELSEENSRLRQAVL